MSEEKQYKAQGYLHFFYYITDDGQSAGIGEYPITIKDMVEQLAQYAPQNEAIYTEMKQDELTYTIYDLIDGMKFLGMVRSGGITDYDGMISEIFVDGYKSNLGLAHDHLLAGEFLVDEKAWEDICKNHTVEVNWANK